MEAIRYIPLDQIECDVQVRRQCDANGLRGLARSIQEVGLQKPIRVRRVNEKYVAVDGERRLHAARLINLGSIAAIVEEKELSEGEILQRQLIANLQHEDVSPCDQAEAVAQLMNLTGWQQAEAGAKCGLSRSRVSKLLAVRELPETIRQRVTSAEIGLSSAYALSQVKEPQRQAELAEGLANGRVTRDEVSQQVRRRRKKLRTSGAAKQERFETRLSNGWWFLLTGQNLDLAGLIAFTEHLLAQARRAHEAGTEFSEFAQSFRAEPTPSAAQG